MDKKLRHQTDEELAQEQRMASSQQQRAREFGSVEEMLRHDAEHVVVPPHLAARVKESVGQEPQAKNWWGRLFGR